MKTLLRLTALALTAAASTAAAQTAGFQQPLEFGLTGGYTGGLSGEAFVHMPNVAGPVGVKLGVSTGAAQLNDSATFGSATYGDFKRIAAAAGTTIRDGGSNTVISADGTYSLGEFAPGVDATVYAGARYGLFNRYISYGTDSTAYSSGSFGVGGGVMASYALTPSTSIVGDLGANHFFSSGITSNDGTTSETLNPGEEGYNDARSLLNLPGTQFKAHVGVKFRF